MKLFLNLSITCLLTACGSLSPYGSDYVRTANQVPVDVAIRLREIGPISAPEPTRPLYTPLQSVEPFAKIVVKRDLRYGAAERHRLDVFTPNGASNKPVLLFMHGGAYVGGGQAPS